MPEHRRKYDPEFKEGAVRLVIDSGRPIAEIAREIDVNPGTLGNWVDKARDAGRDRTRGAVAAPQGEPRAADAA